MHTVGLLPNARTQRRNKLGHGITVLHFAFPDYVYAPTRIAECLRDAGVARLICVELCLPETGARLGRRGPPTAWVAMPKAPMNEHHRAMAGQDDIGRTGKISTM
jgi:hypothetical protein